MGSGQVGGYDGLAGAFWVVQGVRGTGEAQRAHSLNLDSSFRGVRWCVASLRIPHYTDSNVPKYCSFSVGAVDLTTRAFFIVGWRSMAASSGFSLAVERREPRRYELFQLPRPACPPRSSKTGTTLRGRQEVADQDRPITNLLTRKSGLALSASYPRPAERRHLPGSP